jgi:hypothetical protein
MRTESDPRMGSITARNLFGLLQELSARRIHASTIKELHHALAEGGVYPARDLGHLCDSRPRTASSRASPLRSSRMSG